MNLYFNINQPIKLINLSTAASTLPPVAVNASILTYLFVNPISFNYYN